MSKSGYKIKVIFVGLLFIIIGGLLMAGNLGFISINLKEYIFKWQSILIVIGLLSLTKREGIPFGSILIILGVFFHLREHVDLPITFHQIFWPALIMGIGIIIILSRVLIKPRAFRVDISSTEEEFIDDVAIFGGLERTITTKKFKGGRSVSIFGGTKLNMLNSELAEGTHEIEILAIFGGVQYLIPKEWNVKINVVSIFGGFADKRLISENDVDPSKQLIIRGLAVFGGGEIKNIM
ncbi:MAG: hypothetical protein JXJ22_17620 [Bacteroidales bacterium]|nr:hypothetical protein [Bacteroidales bacterium]